MDNAIVKPHKNRRRYALQINTDGDIIAKTPQRSSKKWLTNYYREIKTGFISNNVN